MSNITYDNQFDIINAVVNSTNELIPVLKMNLNVNGRIQETIGQIYDFLKKVLKLLPEIYLSDKKLDKFKQEMIVAFENVIQSWKIFNEQPELFFSSWDEFYLMWEIFEKSVKMLKKDNNTIFISMN